MGVVHALHGPWLGSCGTLVSRWGVVGSRFRLTWTCSRSMGVAFGDGSARRHLSDSIPSAAASFSDSSEADAVSWASPGARPLVYCPVVVALHVRRKVAMTGNPAPPWCRGSLHDVHGSGSHPPPPSGIRLAFGRVLGQTGLLDPPAIALIPRQWVRAGARRARLWPPRSAQRGGFPSRARADSARGSRRARASRSVRCDPQAFSQPGRGSAPAVSPASSSIRRRPPAGVPEFTQDRKVETRIRQVGLSRYFQSMRGGPLQPPDDPQVLPNCMIVTNASRHGEARLPTSETRQ